jgi:hypothetical protein
MKPGISDEDLEMASTRFVVNPIETAAGVDRNGFVEVKNVGTGMLCISRAAVSVVCFYAF